MGSRKLEDLDPRFQPLAREFVARCADLGHPILVTSTRRYLPEQVAYFAQSREPLAEVNRLRAIANLPPITEEQNRSPITWTMKSLHLDGLALDFAILKPGRLPSWDKVVDIDQDDVPDYEEVGIIAESLGLIWGGRWPIRKRDYPHIQFKITP